AGVKEGLVRNAWQRQDPCKMAAVEALDKVVAAASRQSPAAEGAALKTSIADRQIDPPLFPFFWFSIDERNSCPARPDQEAGGRSIQGHGHARGRTPRHDCSAGRRDPQPGGCVHNCPIQRGRTGVRKRVSLRSYSERPANRTMRRESQWGRD